jgi:hypothetical protein
MAAGNCQERRHHPLGWHAPQCWRGHNSLAIIGMVLTSRFFRDDGIEQDVDRMDRTAKSSKCLKSLAWTGGPDGPEKSPTIHVRLRARARART